MKLFFKIFLVTLSLVSNLFTQTITINKRDAEIWSTFQNINGKLNNFYSSSGVLYLNGSPINFNISSSDSSFQIPIIVSEGINNIVIEVSTILSDTLVLELAFEIKPEIFAYAEVNSSTITLKAATIENPKNDQLSYSWSADLRNPQSVSINNATDSIATLTMPLSSVEGEYYFDVLVTTSSGDTTKARTFITLKNSELIPFVIQNDYAAWIDSAVIYEITPYIFVNNGKFSNITTKIPDLVRLGINTIWLQPIYKTFYGGQGYDIIDYFNVRSDLGTEQELRTLIQTAKAYGLKVMFDFVANHSSIQHPYAKNTTQYGTDSHYWDFYQRIVDNAPYSQHYHFYQGFINYFWNDLPNLNFDNPEVQKWITEAAKYWIEKFDIDGYRFDAVWGVTARNAQFTKELRLALKRIKPEIIMLAEDKASQDQVFDERFDVGYDWTPEEDWVSHWSWQTSYNPDANPTIFNYQNQNQRSSLLRSALNNDGNGYAEHAKILRFTENNDTYFFITHHGIDRSRMVAALLLTLNGIPLIYNGQETGKSGHPYSTEFLYFPGLPIDYNDPNHLFPYYKNLIKYRKSLPALYNNNYSEISVTPSNYVFGFRRWFEDQNVFTIMNMGATETSVSVSLPVAQINLDTTITYYLTDLISGEVITGTLSELEHFNISMPKFSSKVYLLADSIVVVSVDDEENKINVPNIFELSQNFPNPFNPRTTISFSIPSEGKVELLVYDILGREIQSLVNEIKTPGQYEVIFDGNKLSTGVYFYRMNFNGYTSVKKMLMIK